MAVKVVILGRVQILCSPDYYPLHARSSLDGATKHNQMFCIKTQFLTLVHCQRARARLGWGSLRGVDDEQLHQYLTAAPGGARLCLQSQTDPRQEKEHLFKQSITTIVFFLQIDIFDHQNTESQLKKTNTANLVVNS